ncbi:MAG: HAMP domain-containing histidine kinase, partial [Candidatus Pacebacteria bacterium]|nr:HAMP domain-containing histidine kinase [Candidatus Paceibacterota bacterium]
SMSGTLANFSVENLLSWNYPAIQLAIENIGGYDPEIILIEVYQEDTIIAKYLSEEYKEVTIENIYKHGFQYNAPVTVDIKDEIKKLGSAKVVLSDKRHEAFLAQEMRSAIICGLILLFGVTILMYLFLHYLILKPLKRIEHGVEVTGSGNLDYRIEIKNRDEIGMLAKTFNEMTIKLKQTQEREKMISKMKSEFISIAAHQLRTPLSAIRWTVDMILNGDMGKINSDVKENLERTYQSNVKLINLMNALLSVSRIEDGRFLCDLKEMSIEKLLRDIVGYSNELALERKVKIKLNIEEEEFPKIKIDVEKLDLALQNLFNNAIKYSHPSSEVDVVLKRIKEDENDLIQIEVQDSGIGISKEDQKRLFTKFFRAGDAVKFQSDGTGLGLFITKNIIEAHGGKIWFESDKDKGTTFFVRLPVNFNG